MKIACIHGYFIIREDEPGEVPRFNGLLGFDLVSVADYFTFESLKDTPNWSLQALPFLGLPAIKTFAGEPWKVMEENGVVYDFVTGVVVPIESVTTVIKLNQTADSYQTNYLIPAGAVTKDWQRVTGYQCSVDVKRNLTYRYSEVVYA